jgi:hypothetical protein
MTPRDHERYRRQLEKQLRADAELLYAAYCAKLRAYETLHQLHGDPGDLDPRLLLPAGFPLSLPPATLPAASPVPVPDPTPPPRKRAHELYNALVAALGQLPEVFDRRDACAVLGHEPHRASLHKVLQYLVKDGFIVVEGWGAKLGNRYRKLPASVPSAPDPAPAS